jgi:putative ABC transport system ATP-binding protein
VTAEIRVRDLTVEYTSGGYRVRPLDGFSLDASDGELVILLGPSGCGKTTLLSVLAGILRPTSGTATVAGVEVTELNGQALSRYRQQTVGVVFQAFNLLPSLNARDNVVVPLRLNGQRRRAARARADELLAEVNLDERRTHRPGQLSGGQQQRVAIARALALDTPVLLADEPTAHLDHVQVEGVLRLLRGLARPGRIVVVSTHDDRIVPLADRLVDLAPRTAAPVLETREFELAAGEILFNQDDASDYVYEVMEGKVELYRVLADGLEDSLRVAGPGDYFGELGPLLRLPRTASARAAGPARLMGMPVAEFRRRRPQPSTLASDGSQ